MRASRIIVVLIVVNVFLAILAAGVILSPEFAAMDAAVRKGKALAQPSAQVAREVTKRPDWKHEIVPPRAGCGVVCRVRSEIILRYYSDDELLRAYVATH